MPVEAKEMLENRLTVNGAAESAGVHRYTVYRWIYAGILPHTRTKTGRIRIEPDDLKEVLALPERRINR